LLSSANYGFHLQFEGAILVLAKTTRACRRAYHWNDDLLQEQGSYTMLPESFLRKSSSFAHPLWAKLDNNMVFL